MPVATRLREAIVQAALFASMTSLTACSSSDDADRDGGGEPGVVQAQLDPYPLELLACQGRVYNGPGPGFHGQCCPKVYCYEPGAGEPCAVPESTRGRIPMPPGSGTCGCQISDGASHMATVVGPFAPNPEHAPDIAGDCCYLVGSIGCD